MELQTLLSALNEAKDGRGQIIMLLGEPGIGKTRCVQELSDSARKRSIMVLWGQCLDFEVAPPYWPWTEALDGYVKTCEQGQLGRQLGQHASSLAELLPSIQAKLPDISIPARIIEPDATQFIICNAVVDFILSASLAAQLLVVLEDLNYADARTLKLLEFFAPRIHSSNVLLVGTYRDVELTRQCSLSKTLGELVRVAAYTRIPLKRLSDSDMKSYMRMSPQFPVSEETVREVIERTEGNPLFLQETVRQFSDDPNMKSVAEGIKEALSRRLDSLSEECNNLMADAAVFGRDFTIDKLQLIRKDFNTKKAIECFNKAVGLGLLEEMPRKYGGYRFAHGLIQETLLAEIPLTQFVQLHADVARALESYHGDDYEQHAAELLYHFDQAKSLLGCDSVVKYAYMAGDRAYNVGAFEESATCFEIRLRCVSDVPMSDREAALFSGFGRVAIALETRLRNIRNSSRYLIDAYDYYMRTNQRSKALSVAFSQLPSGFDTLLVKGAVGFRQMYESALDLVDSNTVEEARILCYYGIILHCAGEALQVTIGPFKKACEVAVECASPNLHMLALSFWINVLYLHLKDDAALSLIKESEHIVGYDDMLPKQKICQTAGYIYLNRIGDAKKAYEYFLEMYRLSKQTHILHSSSVQAIASYYCAFGQWDEARRFISSESHVLNSPYIISSQAFNEFETGNTQRGEELLGILLQMVEDSNGEPGWEWLALASCVPSLVRRGANAKYLDVAERILIELLEIFQLSGAVKGHGFLRNLTRDLAWISAKGVCT